MQLQRTIFDILSPVYHKIKYYTAPSVTS